MSKKRSTKPSKSKIKKSAPKTKTASNNYAKIAKLVVAAEQNIYDQKMKLSKLRRQLPAEPIADFEFKDAFDHSVRLSELFGDKNELILIHNMGKACVYCTLWADGFNGILPHLENRAAVAVLSPDEPNEMRIFAESRNWKFQMFSAFHTSVIEDLGFHKITDKKTGTGHPMPGVSAFFKDNNGNIFRSAKTGFGPGDDFCSLWPLLDLLRNGADKWQPKFIY